MPDKLNFSDLPALSEACRSQADSITTEQMRERGFEQSQPSSSTSVSSEDTMAGNLQAVGDLAGRSWPSMEAAQADSPPHTVSTAEQTKDS